LLDFQRNFAEGAGAVLDGRDIGTVIFPEATAKLFVTASSVERARRRWLELRGKGIDADLATVEADMRRRDERDTARGTAPLRAADDAIVLDTTAFDADAAFRSALQAIQDKLAKSDRIRV
jgi:CMP/dCMP kinase